MSRLSRLACTAAWCTAIVLPPGDACAQQAAGPGQTGENKESPGIKPVVKTEPAAAAIPFPASPADLLTKISGLTRPQWRQFYRTTVNRCPATRTRTALAAGALDGDLHLAAEVRDAQQIRNLLLEAEVYDRHLGIFEAMASARQRLAAVAGTTDWRSVHLEIDNGRRHRERLLRGQKDDTLAELLDLGQWVRLFQASTRVVSLKALETDTLAIGSPEFLATLVARAELIWKTDEEDRCLRTLSRRLAYLEKLWSQPAPDRAARLTKTLESLDELVSRFIQDEPETSSAQ